jgi:hypothetical protein
MRACIAFTPTLQFYVEFRLFLLSPRKSTCIKTCKMQPISRDILRCRGSIHGEKGSRHRFYVGKICFIATGMF